MSLEEVEVRHVPGDVMLRIDFVMERLSIISRWEVSDQEGIAGMPSGWEWPVEWQAERHSGGMKWAWVSILGGGGGLLWVIVRIWMDSVL